MQREHTGAEEFCCHHYETLCVSQSPVLSSSTRQWDGDQGYGMRQREVCQSWDVAVGASQEWLFHCAPATRTPLFPGMLTWSSAQAALPACCTLPGMRQPQLLWAAYANASPLSQEEILPNIQPNPVFCWFKTISPCLVT